MGMLDKETNKDTSQITADAPKSMVGNIDVGDATQGASLDDYYVDAPDAAQTAQRDPTAVTSGTATSYDATMGEVDPSQTSMNLANDYMSMDGAVQQRAMQQGRRDTARSGLLNSSIASGAIAGAVADRVNPLAQTDAGIHSDQRLANQQYSNEAGQFNAKNETDVSLANAAETNQSARTDSTIGADIDMSNTSEANKMSSEEMRGRIQTNLQGMADAGALDREVISSITSQYATDTAAVTQTRASFFDALGDLMTNPNMSEPAVKKQIDYLVNEFGGIMGFTRGLDDLDLGGDGTVQNAAMPDPVVQEPAPAEYQAPQYTQQQKAFYGIE